MKIEEDLYGKKAIEDIESVSKALKYYVERTHYLEIENKRLSDMYENSVNERLKQINIGGK